MSRFATPMAARGFGLIEIMVALVIGLLLIAGVLEMELDGRRGHRLQTELLSLQERGRYAVDLITRDVRRAGFLGGNDDAGTILGRSDASVTATCALDGSWARLLERPLHGLDDAAEDYACMANGARSRGDVLAVHYAAERIAAALVDYRPYLRTSLFRGEVFEGRDDFLVRIDDTPVSTRELMAHAYYVGPGSRTCPDGSTVSALHRMRVGDDGRPVAELLLHGIDQLQARYGVDVDRDGSSDQYLSAAEIAASADRLWSDVRTVRLWLVAASECPQSGYSDARRYDLGDDAPYAPDDRLHRHVFTTTVALRN